MIEIIYKGEDEEVNQELEIKLPKNVRQIGECEGCSRIIYVEDFVMTYLHHFNKKDLKYGVLLGRIERGNGHTYVFISGAVSAHALLDNELIFDEDVWTGMYEEIKMYFDNVEVVGWFAALPSLLNNDMKEIEKLHIDHFAGNDRVCFLIDQEENDENFLAFAQGGMEQLPGFYIYYEKNKDMQAYMSMHVERGELFEQKKEKNVKFHEFANLSEQENASEGENRDSGGTVEKVFSWKKLPSFAYSASSIMLVAVLGGTIALMNASGQLKELKGAVNRWMGKEGETTVEYQSEKETVKFVDVAGNIVKETIGENQNGNENAAEQLTVAGEVTTQQEQQSQNQQTQEQQTQEQQTQGQQAQEQQTQDQQAQEQQTQGQQTQGQQAQEQQTQEQQTQEQQTQSVLQQSPGQEETGIGPQETEPSKEVVSLNTTYVVEKGDSLYTISLKKYGTISRISDIAEANHMENENFIREGETIVLP